MECPHLADKVKLYKGWHKSWAFTDYSVTLYFSSQPRAEAFLQNVIQNVVSNEQEGQDWLQAIMMGSWDASTALTLTRLPNLQHLHLAIRGINQIHAEDRVRLGGEEYYWIMETIMRAAQLQHQRMSSPQALDHLTAITLVPNQAGDRELSMPRLMPFLKLKYVRKLVSWGFDLTSWDTDLDVKISTMEIALQHFIIDKDLFISFFACFPALEKLYYGNYNPAHQFPPNLPRLFNAVARALNRARPRLKELYLTINESRADSPMLIAVRWSSNYLDSMALKSSMSGPLIIGGPVIWSLRFNIIPIGQSESLASQWEPRI